jgi:hypothetical protein
MVNPTLIASAILLTQSVFVQQAGAQQPDHPAHEGHEAPQQQPADPHAGHDMSEEDGVARVFTAQIQGGLGFYPITRDGSGTSWVPQEAAHSGLHFRPNGWLIMTHATVDGVYSRQDGPRGDEKAFVGGMLMASAQRQSDNGDKVRFRAMMGPDPFMGKSGYPLLLAAGETADGVEPLIDRQHPHDLFMELSATYSHQFGNDGVFAYAGLPGEPAFGPPAFMHRPAASASPEAPITHHWMDSTHITFGVITAGWTNYYFKVEASRFRGREPDEDRYDIETGELDSTAVRVSWNPTDTLALQVSWADVASPEQLEPDVDVTKWSASALYTTALFNDADLSFTGAFARKDNSEGVELDAWLAEASWKPNTAWTIFSRAEAIETDELGLIHHGPIEDVAKISLGAVRDFRVAQNVTLGIGALVSQNWVSDALSPLYDGDPAGAMAFVRLKIG